MLARALAREPDVIVIQHGTNDDAFGHSLGRFLGAYRDTVRDIRTALPNTKIVCMTISPRWDSLKSDADWLNLANVGIQEIAALEGTLLAQSYAKLRNRRDLFSDGIHPDDEGRRLLADSVLEALAADESPTCAQFDLVFSGPGRHRICGYTIEAHPDPRAGEAQSARAGWVEIHDFSLDGFSYQSDYVLTIATAMRTCRKNPVSTIRRADGSTSKLTGERASWCGAGSYTLPSSPDHPARIEISR